MAAKVKDLIKALKQFPDDMELVDRKMFALTKGGADAYDLNLKVRLVGIGSYKDEGLVFIIEHNEEMSKIADITKISSDRTILAIHNQQNKKLLNLLRLLVEGGDNTSEFLSLAGQYTSLDIPSYEDIVKLYKEIVTGAK